MHPQRHHKAPRLDAISVTSVGRQIAVVCQYQMSLCIRGVAVVGFCFINVPTGQSAYHAWRLLAVCTHLYSVVKGVCQAAFRSSTSIHEKRLDKSRHLSRTPPAIRYPKTKGPFFLDIMWWSRSMSCAHYVYTLYEHRPTDIPVIDYATQSIHSTLYYIIILYLEEKWSCFNCSRFDIWFLNN